MYYNTAAPRHNNKQGCNSTQIVRNGVFRPKWLSGPKSGTKSMSYNTAAARHKYIICRPMYLS